MTKNKLINLVTEVISNLDDLSIELLDSNLIDLNNDLHDSIGLLDYIKDSIEEL